MNILKKGFTYYVLSTVFIALILMLYIKGDVIAPMLDFSGWVFFITSCISHSAILLLVLWLVFFLPWALLRRERLAKGLYIGSVSILAILAFINMQVYKIYRFHINGFIINMLTGPAAGDIFDFDAKLFLSEGLLLVVILLVTIGLWMACVWMAPRWSRRHTIGAIVSLTAFLLVANGCYMYGSFVMKPSIVKSTKLIPYYFPL